ncbi:MAG: DNA translocase FtsK 4TM domain-containing protein [Pyrinomonadaceae bacterium]|nr:DNA translocase FtsK 4TM domain-containing protein [Pyrinomonadaceae bacterium]
MAVTEAKQNAQEVQQQSLTNEIVGIVLLAISVLLALCLFTYNAADPSFHTASAQETHNFIGTIGANIAAILLQSVGVSSYLLPFLILLIAWRVFWAENLFFPTFRIVGFVILVVCFSALLSLSGLSVFFDGSVPSGGLIGALTARSLSSGLGNVGASILLIAFALMAFALALDVSFVPVLTRFNLLIEGAKTKLLAWRAYEKEQARLRFENRRAMRNGAVETLKNDFSQKIEVQPQTLTAQDTQIVENKAESGFLVLKAKSFAAATMIFLKRLRQPPDVKSEESLEVVETKTLASSDKDSEAFDVSEHLEQKTVESETPEAANGDDVEVIDVHEKPVDLVSDITIAPRKIEDFANLDEDEFSEVKEFDNFEVEVSQTKNQSVEGSRKQKPRVTIPFADYKLPTSDFLNAAPPRINHADIELLDIAGTLTEKCREFKANGKVVNICPGPVVTTYEYKLDAGVKFNQISKLVDDLCLGLKAESIRIDRIPGKAFVGVEVPNPRRETIYLREVIESKAFRESESLLTIALGKTVDGLNSVTDLSAMPHLLIAGATGAGKSVGVNSLIVSILYKARPDEVKFIMVDPKQVELNLYADIPHLATPIITDSKRAAIALKWAVVEMERRYKALSGWHVRNIAGYNAEVHRRNFIEEFDENGEAWQTLPYIVIIIDEFADLMMVARGEVEESIMRLAQKARAVGVHLVLATQRPSVDVVTGVIKANLPSRIAFRVSSSIDSRTIINGGGAEHLLGRGDMLFMSSQSGRITRVHGTYIDENEIGKIVAHIKAQGTPDYDTTITQTDEETEENFDENTEHDELFEQALRICVEMDRASTSVLQRRLSIGYGRAAKIIDAMEREGYVAQSEGASKPRQVLAKAKERISDWNEMSSQIL